MSTWTERAYTRAPIWLQNAGISAYGLKFRHERLGGRFAAYVTEYRDRETWARPRFEDFCAAQLRQVLVNAWDCVPYYRRVFENSGWSRARLDRVTPQDLWQLPITPKSDLRDRPEEFLSAPPERLHRYHTSGSTGTPVTTWCSSDDHRRFIAAREARSFGWAGVSVRMPRSTIGGRPVLRDSAEPPFYRRNWAERQVYFSAYHISRARLASYVEGFNRCRPEVLTGFAQAHYLLAELMLRDGVRLNYTPRALILGSEPLTPQMKDTLRRAFGARAYEEYGSVENCVLATECEAGRLHAHPDFGLTEIVDDEGLPVPPGVTGRVLCTSFAATAQPLIRYDIGDLAAWSEDPCRCGRSHLPVLEDLVGRLEDVIVGRNGNAMLRLHGLFVNVPHVVEGQIVQESLDLLRVRVVAGPGFGEDQIRAIRRRIEQEQLGDMRVVIEPVPAIERTERGKFRAVVSRLPGEVRARALYRSLTNA